MLSLLQLFVTFISEFENTQNSFSCVFPFDPFRSVKYLKFWPKATNLYDSSYFSRKETSWGYQKSILCFLSTRQSQIPIFLGPSSWTTQCIQVTFKSAKHLIAKLNNCMVIWIAKLKSKLFGVKDFVFNELF